MSERYWEARWRDEKAHNDALVKALEFYADGKRYNGPNMRRVEGDPYTAADAAYMKDVTRDGGGIARAALSQVNAVVGGPVDSQ